MITSVIINEGEMSINIIPAIVAVQTAARIVIDNEGKECVEML